VKYGLGPFLLAISAGVLAAAIFANATSDVGLLFKLPGHFLGSYLPLLVSIHIGVRTLTVSVWDIVIYSLLAYTILIAALRLKRRRQSAAS